MFPLLRYTISVSTSMLPRDSAFACEMKPRAFRSCSSVNDPELNVLPQIGFYHVCGADHSVLRGTEFAAYQSIFDDAWNHILNAIVTASRYQIGVLLGKGPIAQMHFCSSFGILRSYLQTCMQPLGSRYVPIAEV